jgi:hypothetical protein
MKTETIKNTIWNNAMNWLMVLLISIVLTTPLTMADDSVSAEDIKAARQVIASQISAFKADDYELAYSFAAPNVKQVFTSAKAFKFMVQSGYTQLYQHTSYSFGESTSANDEVYQEIIVTDESGQLWRFVYSLDKQQDQSWKITSVVMHRYEGKSV